MLLFGSRGSTKLVRCYFKWQVNAYRVEPEIHAALLRKIGLANVSCLGVLYGLIPKHLGFVRVSWPDLAQYLQRKFPEDAEALLEEARRRRAKAYLHVFLRLLKGQGVSNPHLFLRPMRINREMKAALARWLEGFSREEDQERWGTVGRG